VLQSHDVMELRQLNAFVAVAEERTFTRAAERLGVVQPAVSQAIGRLEDELGLVLFERSSRRVTLTSAGTAFLPKARAVLAQVAEAEKTGSDLAAGRTGLVRLATTPGTSGLVRALLVHHRAAHPGVRVELTRAYRTPKLRAILAGEIDVALTHSAPPTPGLSFTEIWQEPWQPVASVEHPLASSGPVALRALAADPLVTVAGRGTAGIREQFAELCRSAGFQPIFGPTHATLGDALVEIAQSTAWTLLRASNTHDLARVGVTKLPIADPLPPAQLWLAHHTDPAPATRALLALVERLHGSERLISPPEEAGGPEG
jgi:DNA-binding transcriptional LysR family regulator